MLSRSRRMKDATFYTKSRIAKTKDVKRSLRKLCDDEDSADNRDAVAISSDSSDSARQVNSPSKGSEDRTLKLNRKSETGGQVSSKSSENFADLKSSGRSNRKTNSNRLFELHYNTNSSISTDDSENYGCSWRATLNEKPSRERAKKHQRNLRSESSSKELQCSKRTSTKTDKQIDGNASKCKRKISKEQSISFKLQVVKILNRFKELCSEYELHMEHFKLKHFRKEVSHMETADEIVQKSAGLIREMATSLQEEEQKLHDFFDMFKKELSQECESSSNGLSDSEEEELKKTQKKEKEDNKKDKRFMHDTSSVKKLKDKDLKSKNFVSDATKLKKPEPSLSSDKPEAKDTTENSKESEVGKVGESNEKQRDASTQEVLKGNFDSNVDSKEVESEASGYDVKEIFSDEEINNLQRCDKNELITRSDREKLTEENTENPISSSEERFLEKKQPADETRPIESERKKENVSESNKQRLEETVSTANASDVNSADKDKQKEAAKTLEKPIEDTISSESSKAPETGDTEHVNEEANVNETPRSPTLKPRRIQKPTSTNEMNESLADLFDSTSDNDESTVNITLGTVEKSDVSNTISKNIEEPNTSVQKQVKVDTINEQYKQSAQAKTKPTESAKKELLKSGVSKQSNEAKKELDSEEERAKRMMLESEDSESDSINIEDISEKSVEHDRRDENTGSGIANGATSKNAANRKEYSSIKSVDMLQEMNVKSETGNGTEKPSSEKKKESSDADDASATQKNDAKEKNGDTADTKSGGDDDTASDITEILILDSSCEHQQGQQNPLISTESIKKELRKDSVDEIEETAKKALLDSDSDNSSTSKKSKVQSNEKSSKTRTAHSSSDNESSHDESRVFTRRLRKRKLEKNDMASSRTKRRRYQIDVTRFQDPKLEAYCSVIIRRMSGALLEKYEKALKRSKLRLDRKTIKNLIALERLGRDHKDSSNTNDAWTQLKNARKRKKIKEPESTLMDHLDLSKTENRGGSDMDGKHDSDFDEDEEKMSKLKSRVQTNEELMREADMASKALLLNSSDSDIDIETVINDESNDSENGNNDKKEISKKGTEGKKSSSSKKGTDDYEKNKWRKCKVLTSKLSDLDEKEELEQWKVKKEKLEAEDAAKKHGEEENIQRRPPRKRRTRRRIFDSDSNIESSPNSESEETEKSSKDSDSGPSKKKKRTRKRSTCKSSDTDSSLGEKKVKTKRKRLKNVADDSDSDSDKVPNSQENSGGKGRKNIRKVMKDKQVAEDTKQAAKEEEERLKRIAERQRIYNEMYEARLAGEKKVEKLVLDFNPDTKEELITVDQNLVKRLKPHQAEGIKFMWDACFESMDRIKNTPGSGCIIAHCMGLGKSMQVVTLVHTLLSHEETGVKTILIVCPLSTVLNWMNEFEIWLKDVENANDINVYEMTRLKKNFERKRQLEHWQRTTGVMIMSYNMFRNLTGAGKMAKKMKESFLNTLVDPGADLVICDEGHLLKNEDTALSKSMKKIKTLRRIVLTGTPLQNNLVEYHCMVQFVKPNLLGTKREFLNRFVNPITNGQFDDSTEYDVKLMKKRAYVLHKMLKGCVQRFDYSVLTPFLPPKQEYVIFVSLTDVQIKMYRHYLENFASRRAMGGLFTDFQALQRIWTHPILLQLNSDKTNEKRRYSSESEGSLKDFINDSTTDSESDESSVLSNSSDDSDVQTIDDDEDQDANALKKSKESGGCEKGAEKTVEEEDNAVEKEWWMDYVQPEHFEDMRTSSKLVLLFGILKECEEIGDKVLVFSQSLYSLTLIEQFLERIDEQTQKGEISENLLGHSGSWTLGLDYFRLDGQTSAENRRVWCRIFNRPNNTRARLFLISTRAGGLGINLTAANRVIIFDASWNPSHDVQSIFRVYRFGQRKPAYVYRFLATGTMEEKIYNRQVTKLSLSCRVIDEQQIERHYSNHDLNELYNFEPNMSGQRPTLALPKDRLLAEIFLKYKDCVENYHEHDSLLENKVEEELDEEERKIAWLEYEQEKKGKILQPYVHMPMYQGGTVADQFKMPVTPAASLQIDYENLQQLISKDYPNATPEQQRLMTNRALREMYNYWERQAMLRPPATPIISQNSMVGNMPRHQPTILKAQIGPAAGQMPQITQMHAVQNVNPNFVPNPFVYRNAEATSSAVPDDDVVEVSATPLLAQALQSNKNKEQEE